MLEFLASRYTIHRIVNLRTLAILVQLVLILLVDRFLSYEFSLNALLTIIAVEVLFNLICIAIYRHRINPSEAELFIQHTADIVFLAALLYFSGGATNAFVSLLLIPIALAAVTLSLKLMVLVTVIAIAAYTLLLYLMPAHAMHMMDMEEHFVGMWVNFLFSAGVVSLVVGQMAREVSKREKAILNFKEEQLKQEQVLAIGVASAQVTHQLATPIASVQLLADELSEDMPDNVVLQDMQGQLARCRDNIRAFRQLAVDTKAQKVSAHNCRSIVKSLQEHIHINFPEIDLEVEQRIAEDCEVLSDMSLVPALLNLMQNGIRASSQNGSAEIDLTAVEQNGQWQLTIRDYGPGFSKNRLAELGANPIPSEQGLGMAVFLSLTSLDRLGGQLELKNHDKVGAQVIVTLPLVKKGH